MHYDYTRLLTRNFRETFHFYEGVLGLLCVFGSEADSYAEFEVREDSSVGLSLFDAMEMEAAIGTKPSDHGPTGDDRVCLVFGVQDVDDTYRSIASRGGVLVAPPVDHPEWGIRTAHVRDPEGNLIEINAPLS